MCLKINATGAIKFFLINSGTKNQHHSLLSTSSSLGKLHTARDVPTPGSSAGSHVEVPSAGLSRPFGCCPQFQNDYLWGGIWVARKGISHTDWDQASMRAAEPLEYIFWSKHLSQRWQCERERSRHAASNCPHAQFLGQNVVDGLAIQIQLTTDYCDCQTSIKPHDSPHIGHICICSMYEYSNHGVYSTL
jgi:hypothetical protein